LINRSREIGLIKSRSGIETFKENDEGVGRAKEIRSQKRAQAPKVGIKRIEEGE